MEEIGVLYISLSQTAFFQKISFAPSLVLLQEKFMSGIFYWV